MTLKAWGDNLLVKEESYEGSTTTAGIFVGEDKNIRISRGEVLSIGQGTLLPNAQIVPIPLSVGDRIMFHSDVANKIIEEGEEMWIIPRKCVIGLYS